MNDKRTITPGQIAITLDVVIERDPLTKSIRIHCPLVHDYGSGADYREAHMDLMRKIGLSQKDKLEGFKFVE